MSDAFDSMNEVVAKNDEFRDAALSEAKRTGAPISPSIERYSHKVNEDEDAKKLREKMKGLVRQ